MATKNIQKPTVRLPEVCATQRHDSSHIQSFQGARPAGCEAAELQGKRSSAALLCVRCASLPFALVIVMSIMCFESEHRWASLLCSHQALVEIHISVKVRLNLVLICGLRKKKKKLLPGCEPQRSCTVLLHSGGA